MASDGLQSIDPPIDVPPPATRPVQYAPDWYPDPFGRHERRYWDGNRWTDHVVFRGEPALDPPGVQVSGPAEARQNKDVARQARRAGAGGNPVGGGTLFSEPVLVINQKAKAIGSTLGFAVYAQNGQQLGMVQGLRRDFATTASEKLLGQAVQSRTYRLQFVSVDGRILLTMTRPAEWFTSKSAMIVGGPDGTAIGQIVQETHGVLGDFATLAHAGLSNASLVVGLGVGFVAGKAVGGAVGSAAGKAVGAAAGWVAGHAARDGAYAATELSGASDRLRSAAEGLDKIGHVRFGLEAGDQRLGSIHAETIEEWDFRIDDPAGVEVARITKAWAGWAKERFTKADHYVLVMHQQLEQPLLTLVIAAAVALDLALKQGDPTHGHGRRRRYE